MKRQQHKAMTYPLITIKKAVLACIACKIPVAVWGGVGIGKSSLINQIARDLKRTMYDLRLSDKEPSDLGGIPYPITGEDGATRHVEWLIASGRIPFRTPGRKDEDCILFMDEIDRTETATQNVALQLLLDRCVNGHQLVEGCSIVAAGNGTSDSGTTPLTSAAAGRMVHLYVDTASRAAVESWDKWAERNGVSPWMRGFASYRQSHFMGEAAEFVEMQAPHPRAQNMADRLIQFCDGVEWGESVIEPLVFGAVGQVAGREALAFRKLFLSCPTPEQIEADPRNTAIPSEFGVCWALGAHLINIAANDGNEKKHLTKAFATYANRFPEEQRGFFYQAASVRCQSIVNTPEYKAWEKAFRL
jgi:hypothetical protein